MLHDPVKITTNKIISYKYNIIKLSIENEPVVMQSGNVKGFMNGFFCDEPIEFNLNQTHYYHVMINILNLNSGKFD